MDGTRVETLIRSRGPSWPRRGSTRILGDAAFAALPAALAVNDVTGLGCAALRLPNAMSNAVRSGIAANVWALRGQCA